LSVRLHMSTAYYPNTDGLTKRMNQCLETYLRCICLSKLKSWNKWLSLTQWWYNSSSHDSLKQTPFEALFGYKPPLLHAMMQYSNIKVVMD